MINRANLAAILTLDQHTTTQAVKTHSTTSLEILQTYGDLLRHPVADAGVVLESTFRWIIQSHLLAGEILTEKQTP